MQIRKIILRNLHSIRSEAVIDFTVSPLLNAGLFAITGDTGAGKTTILDALTLAMYGRVCRKSRPEEALSHGAEQGMAACEFEAGGRIFLCQWRCRIPRSKKENPLPKTERTVAEWNNEKQIFQVVAERKVTEVNAFVEEVSGLDFERFTRSAMLAQGDFAAFLKAAPRERSELLERITGTEYYSEISKAAHERYSLERTVLSELVAKREQLQLFSREELTEKKLHLKEKQQAANELNVELEKAKTALQWLRQLAQLQLQYEVAAKNLEGLEAEKSNLRTSEEILLQHRKTLPLHPTLARLDDKLLEVENLGETIFNFSQKLDAETAAAQICQTEYEETKKVYEAQKAVYPAAMQRFEQVALMDAKLASLAGMHAKTSTDFQAEKLKKQATESQIAEQFIKEKEHETALLDLKNWLRTNAVWASLPQDLPAITIHRELLRENLKTQNRVKEEMNKLQSLAENAGKKATKLENLLLQEKKSLAELSSAFQKAAPENFVPNRQELLGRLAIEIETLGEQHKNFSKLHALSNEYRAALNDLSLLESRLDELRQEELWLDKSLLSAYEEAEEWEQQLAYRREVFNQQLLLANYEKDRANLQEGEACPLCLSTHHPFRLHAVKPFVDAAQSDLEAAERAQRERQRQRNLLLKKHIEINTQILQLETAETGDIAKLEAKLFSLEQRLAATLPGFDGEDFSRSHGEWLVRRMVGFESELSEKRAVREDLAKLHQEISSKEELVRQLEIQLKDERFAEQQNSRSLADREATWQDLEAKFNEATSELNKLVGKYGYSFSLANANLMFQELVAKEDDFSNKKASREGHERQLELTKQSIQQLTNSLTELEKSCQKLIKEILGLETEIEILTTKRREIFGDKNLEQEREKLIEELDAAEQALAISRSKNEAVNANLGQIRHEIETNEKLMLANQKQLEFLQDSLTKGFEKMGFENMEALRMAILPMHEATQIEAEIEKFRHVEVEAKLAEKSANKALKEALEKSLTSETEVELEGKVLLFEASYQDLQQEIGALTQQLKDNDIRKISADAFLQQIENQRLVNNRWAAVNDLIGSHDGSKFRKFAQGLTLQKLVQLANFHLENLYGRYFIIKRPGEDLELDIVDTYQADNVRSMMTLSGGESFLVSLALALGLSDLAGRNANIRSLFIDEGFGTLDEQTLDLAITTLENLQAKGKTIGVISHVKELKERIPTQVRVMKKGGGTSVVQVI